MRSLVARMPVVVLQGRVGGPLVAPRTSGRLGISPWRATLRHCPGRMARLLLRRTAHVEVAWRWGRVRGARHLPSSCDHHGAEPSRPWCKGLSALVPLPAWHGLPVAARQMGDDGAVHTSSWVGRHGGDDVLAPSSGLAQRGLLPAFDREQDHVIAGAGGHELETPKPNHRRARNR